MHDAATVSSVSQPFDGVIDIDRHREGDAIVRKIAVLSMKDTAPDEKFHEFVMITGQGMVIGRAGKVTVPEPAPEEPAKPPTRGRVVRAAPSASAPDAATPSSRAAMILRIAEERIRVIWKPMPVRFEVNGRHVEVDVEPRLTLADCLRHHLRLTGTHVGCEHGVCGACTVIVDGAAVRSCLMLAVQADGAKVVTVEGLSNDEALTPLQASFRRHHALQCGFCTPGMITTAHALLSEEPDADADRVREVLSGNLCRCTGYISIVEAVLDARAAYRKPDQ